MSDETANREEELRRIPLQRGDPSKWPKGVRVIGIDELGSLGIDLDGRLYWDGKPVEIIGQRLELSPLQRVSALIVVLAALATIGEGLIVVADWACRVQWVTNATFCGPPA